MILQFEDYKFPSLYEAPKPHQIETVKFLLKNPRSYNLSGMGVGKTLSALWACDFLFINEKIQKVLIVGPLSTLDCVWADSIHDHLPHRTYAILHGTKAYRLQQLSRKVHFYIINHDGPKFIEDALLKAKFDIVIIDELTCCKNFSAKRTKTLKKICDKARAVWGLTGEPTPNSPEEAYGQSKVVNPARAPRYFTQFRDDVMMQLDPFTYIPKLGWEKKVAAILSPSIRYTLDQVAKDMPPVTFEERMFEMTKEQQKAYDQMYKDFVVEHQNGLITASNSGVKANKLLQISCGGVIDTPTGEVLQLDCGPKLSGLWDMYQETRKLIVFVPFRAALAMIEDFFKKKGVSVDVVHGDTKKDARKRIFDSFQRNELDVLVMHPRTSAHGLTLTASRVIIWFGPYIDNEIFNQANARIRRFGQTHPQLVIKFWSSTTEKRAYKVLDRKGKMSQNLLELFQG